MWSGHVFEVSPSVIRSFDSMTIKGSSETEEKTTGGQKYVSRKNGKPAEVGITVILSAHAGCDVREEAMALVDEARLGTKGYFYIGGKKLMACPLMLTDAVVSEMVIAASAAWVQCEVKLTLKQCGKYDGESGGSGGSGGKSSGADGKSSLVDTVVIGAIAGQKATTAKDQTSKMWAETAATFNRHLVNAAKKAAAEQAKKKEGASAPAGVKFEPMHVLN